MTTLRDVAREAGGGATAETIAARLGASPSLVVAMLEELERCGVVAPSDALSRCSTPGGSACSAESQPPTCAGCPLATGGTAARGAGPIHFLGRLGTRRTDLETSAH